MVSTATQRGEFQKLNHTRAHGSEMKMNSTTSQVEVTLETKSTTTLETTSQIEALKELADFELAYVGGGTAVVTFT
jgi:predicted alternative tryptophan synthase beta-subunit